MIMMSLESYKLQINNMIWPNETLNILARIQEYKGMQSIFKRQFPKLKRD